MANPGSFTRSAARATSSAYRRLPIRWRLAGGSAVLTLIILLGFAAIVGVLTQRRIYNDFDTQVSRAADELQRSLRLRFNQATGQLVCETRVNCPVRDLDLYTRPQNAAVRILILSGDVLNQSTGAPRTLGTVKPGRSDFEGYRVETRPLLVSGVEYGYVYVQYARRLSDVKATVARVRVFLGLGVLGGTVLALLAGLATARRAMAPIAGLTRAAREIERTGDPSLQVPMPAAEDEVAELARTFEDMLRSLDTARAETEGALTRQREFVADASHELRTPLTAVLANLELLEEELAGEQRDTAAAALRSTQRMRRLVADLLLLARADAGREVPHEPVDLTAIVIEAAAELGPVAGEHRLTVSGAEGTIVDGSRDELHRLALNLMDNALKHTAPGTEVRATIDAPAGGEVVLIVADDGPGVPDEVAPRVFDRFVRGASDRGGSSGLGLSIVRAVAETHGGSVALAPSEDGARFVVRLPQSASGPRASSEPEQPKIRKYKLAR